MPHTEVTKIRSPGDIVATIPYLVGFLPTESLVALSLRHPGGRVGLTTRADLAPEEQWDAQVATTVHAMAGSAATGCILVVHTNLPDTPERSMLPFAALIGHLVTALAGKGVEVREALLVRAGRWWSYLCRLSCCPPEGTPCLADSPTVLKVAADSVYEGRAVLRDRAQLVASLAPVLPFGPMPAVQRQDRALQSLAAALAGDRPATVARELDQWQVALDAWERRPGALAPQQAARLAMALHDGEIRDTVTGWLLSRQAPLLGLLIELCRGSVPPADGYVCAVTGWVAYAGGDGALAVIATERALATDPKCALARLLLDAMDRLVTPDQLRALLRKVASLTDSG